MLLATILQSLRLALVSRQAARVGLQELFLSWRSLQRNADYVLRRYQPGIVALHKHESVNFGKGRNAVATVQADSLIIGDSRLNNRDVQSDKANMFDDALWAKVLRTDHVKSFSPETLAIF